MPNFTRPPKTIEELIPYIEQHGFHLHYNLGQSRWTFVGFSRAAMKHCRPDNCYKLRIKNHREETS